MVGIKNELKSVQMFALVFMRLIQLRKSIFDVIKINQMINARLDYEVLLLSVKKITNFFLKIVMY